MESKYYDYITIILSGFLVVLCLHCAKILSESKTETYVKIIKGE